MTLYHFCPEHLLGSIKKVGLTLGMLPLIINGECRISAGCQWLTKNKSFTQSWDTESTLPYKRNAYCITIKIPKDDKKLFNWLEFSNIPLMKETAATLNAYGDPQNWFIYLGNIKNIWFRDIVKND